MTKPFPIAKKKVYMFIKIVFQSNLIGYWTISITADYLEISEKAPVD